MPLSGAEFITLSEDQILRFLENELQNEYGENIDLTQSSAFRTFAAALARHNAEEIQPALQEVHEAGFIETASGRNLELKVEEFGIERRAASHATGTIRFQHGSTTDQTYTIQNGTVVQTGGSETIEFATTELVTISLFDDFESGSLSNAYDGDLTEFTVQSDSTSGVPSAAEGSQVLEAASTSGAMVENTSNLVSIGSTMDFRVYLQDDGGSEPGAANCFAVQSGGSYYRVHLNESGAHQIQTVTSNSTTNHSSSSFTVPVNEWLRNEIEWKPANGGTIISRIYDASGNLLDSITATGVDDFDAGGIGFQSVASSQNIYWDHSGERSVLADARAVEGGPDGNVGANTLTDMPSVPSGVDSVTNPNPMGDDSYVLTSGEDFTPGFPRESDEELRERASVSRGAPGDATVPSLIAALQQLPGATSIRVEENKTNTDNTGSGGLPPKSFEVVYYGTDPDEDVAQTIFDERAFTANDHGGAHGTQKSYTITADNGQDFTVEWSEPTEVDVDMTIDVVVNDSYVGNNEVRDRIVEYVGGTRSDGNTVLGQGEGEDVYLDQVKDIVTGPDDTGVIGVSNLTTSPSATTDANGLDVVSIGSGESATTDATDGSISFNVTRV